MNDVTPFPGASERQRPADAAEPDAPAVRWSGRRTLIFIVVASGALWGMIIFGLYVLFVVAPAHLSR